MIVGLLSDTHGRIEPTKAGLAALRDAGAEFYIHSGDIGEEAIFDLLAGLPLAFVWGNNDDRRSELATYARAIGLACHEEFADLHLGDKDIAVTHGDRDSIIRKILGEHRHHYLIHGHTHLARNELVDGIRFINPGALHRAARPSVATLDTARDCVTFYPMKRSF